MRFDRDSTSGLMLPRERRIEPVRRGLCDLFAGPTFFSAGGVTDPYFASVSRLYHLNGADGSTTFTDSSSYAQHGTANGNVQIDTAQSKFDGASALFDGSGDYLGVPDNTETDFTTGDATVEVQVRFNSVAGTQIIGGRQLAGNSFAQWQLWFTASKFAFRCWDTSDVLVVNIAGATTITAGPWYHVAWTRNGSTFTLWLEGVSDGTASTANALCNTAGQGIRFGISSDGAAAPFNGWMDEIRLTKGVARYTATFTPPTEAFPNA